MKKRISLFILSLFSLNLFAPPNCKLYENDEKCLESCKYAMKAIRYRQGSYQSQKYFNKSIESCPTFAYSYKEKAVPYLKRGLFTEWKKLIDKAVELEPKEYLGYRGWCKIQFLRDYKGAIKDIEKLKSLVNYDIGYCQTGDYHLNIALALCYKQIGNYDKAKQLFLDQLSIEKYSQDLYDYYHLGVLEYEARNYEEAIKYFNKQLKVNDNLAETYYFIALAYKKMNQLKLAKQHLEKAENYYRNNLVRTDTYTETIDKVYLTDILEEKELLTLN